MTRYACYLLMFALTAALGAARAQAEQATGPGNQPPAAAAGSTAKPELTRLEPKLDLNPPGSRGQPEAKTPDRPVRFVGGVVEKDLAIEWDDWHNKVAQAVLPHIFNSFAEALNVPAGTTTWLHFEITSDKHVRDVKVLKSSGMLWYDRLVRDAFYKLDGNDVLTFPADSKRTWVATNVAISKGGKHKSYIVFGDIEYQEVDGNDGNARSADNGR